MYENTFLLGSGANALPPRIELPPYLRKLRLRRYEVSEYLLLVYGIQVAPATLAKWACYGEGPEMEYLNRTPLYLVTELDAWVLRKLKRSNLNAE
jgi:hypothetical protein